MTSDWETKTKFIAEAMKEMKYVNMFNQGIRRVQDMLLENGRQDSVRRSDRTE